VRISEVFTSIQGEGLFTGTPSVFVRTTGCNLRCWFCDTPYTSWFPEGVQRSWQDLHEEILRHDILHVVLTGGEPLLQPALVPLSHALRDAGRFVTIETAGTVVRPVHADLMSISPKLSNSLPLEAGRWQDRHDRISQQRAPLKQLLGGYDYQLKFVIDTPQDLTEVSDFLEDFPGVDPTRVWLMPQGTRPEELAVRTEWLAPLARQYGFRLSPRRHIELFGHRRGT